MALITNYVAELKELTFNSKPKINILTIIAGENLAEASSIVAAVENNLRRVRPKLPTLYLMDSIVKNIGGIYVAYFARNLADSFCTAFRESPQEAPKMVHLFNTWQAGSVFPPDVLAAIGGRIAAMTDASRAPAISAGGWGVGALATGLGGANAGLYACVGGVAGGLSQQQQQQQQFLLLQQQQLQQQLLQQQQQQPLGYDGYLLQQQQLLQQQNQQALGAGAWGGMGAMPTASALHMQQQQQLQQQQLQQQLQQQQLQQLQQQQLQQQQLQQQQQAYHGGGGGLLAALAGNAGGTAAAVAGAQLQQLSAQLAAKLAAPLPAHVFGDAAVPPPPPLCPAGCCPLPKLGMICVPSV